MVIYIFVYVVFPSRNFLHTSLVFFFSVHFVIPSNKLSLYFWLPRGYSHGNKHAQKCHAAAC